MRMSGRAWQEHQVSVHTGWGFETSLVEPRLFWNADRAIALESHGDDTFAVGPRNEIEKLRTELHGGFDGNCSQVIGPDPRDKNNGFFLERAFSVSLEGWSHEADPKRIQKLLYNAGLENARAAATPGVK